MKISLTGSDTQSRSVLASCQRNLNCYSEATDQRQGEPAELTHYPTPGLTLLSVAPNNQAIRCLYKASNGDLYAVAGFEVYYISPSWIWYAIGTMNPTSTVYPCKMADNGVNVILVDGSTNGYAITMSTQSGLAPLYDPSASDDETTSSTGWLGSNYADFVDGYFICNSPGTPSWYISNSTDVVFDPGQFASKDSAADSLVAAVVQHRVPWLIGEFSTEIWYDNGIDTTLAGDNFPYELMPGVAIDWGCCATYSIAKAETSLFWLAQNLNGETCVLRGTGYTVARISTHAVEAVFSGYSTISDATAYCVMMQGHSRYIISFPTADATWAYDLATNSWAELAWIDNSGNEHRHRGGCHAFAYNTNVVGDWQNGNIYNLSMSAYTDNGQPISRIIGFPRQIDNEDGHRMLFKNFLCEMDTGESVVPGDNPMVTLRWSDDKGKTWNSPGLQQSLGPMGSFSTIMKFNRLGQSRNRVFRLEFAVNAFWACQGAWVDTETCAS